LEYHLRRLIQRAVFLYLQRGQTKKLFFAYSSIDIRYYSWLQERT
jgi:hypothetical protein